MGSKVLGKITGSLDQPRGPDVEMALSIPAEWLEDGVTLSIELPRNLACAVCRGGGCDACARAGAVSLRGRKEPPELVEVTLPRREESAPESSLLVRIPERGGLPAEGVDVPRGHLFLSISAGTEVPRGVQRLAQPSIPPPAGPAPEIIPSRRPGLEVAGPSRAWMIVLLLVAIGLALAAWFFR